MAGPFDASSQIDPSVLARLGIQLPPGVDPNAPNSTPATPPQNYTPSQASDAQNTQQVHDLVAGAKAPAGLPNGGLDLGAIQKALRPAGETFNPAPKAAPAQQGVGGVPGATGRVDTGYVAPRGGGRPGTNPMVAYGQGVDASQQRQNEILGQQGDAEQQHVDNVTKLGNQLGDVYQNAADNAGHINDAKNQAIQMASTSMQQTEKDLQDKMADIKDIDPERWYNSKSTFGKIMNHIALGLGTFGAKYTGHNSALDIMQDQIHSDIAAQQKNREQQWQKIHEGNELAKNKWARAQYVADQSDKDVQLGWKKADALVEMTKARNVGPEAQANLSNLQAGIQGKMEENNQKMFQTRLQVAQAIAAAQAAGAGGMDQQAFKFHQERVKEWDKLNTEGKATTQAPTWEETRRLFYGRGGAAPPAQGLGGSASLESLPKERRERAVVLDDGSVHLAPSKEAAEEFRKNSSHANDALAGLDEVIGQRQKNGGGTLSGQQTKLLNGRLASVIPSINETQGLSRFTELEKKMIEQGLPEDANAYSPMGTVEAQLQATRNLVSGRKARMYKDIGLQPLPEIKSTAR